MGRLVCPTEKQYGLLRPLGSGAAGLAWRKRDTEMLMRRGWVTAEQDKDERYYHWVTITPEGLRALALAVERYDWPKFEKPMVERRVCSDCGAAPLRQVCKKCGGGHYYYETKPVEEVIAA